MSEPGRPELTAADLPPDAIGTYLGSTGWNLLAVANATQIWRSPEQTTLRLPMDNEYLDFPQRYYEAVRLLRSVHDWDTTQLVNAVLGVRSDFMYIRADQFSADGSIPIKQAETLLSEASSLLLSGAASAVAPKATHVGRRPAAAQDFVAEDVRMGHTQRGSFIITVLARLGPDVELDAETTSGDEILELDEAARRDTIRIPPFQRRAMSNVATGVQASRLLALSQASVDDAVSDGVSTNMLQSLETMATSSEGLRSIDISFSWAPAEEAPPPQVDTILIDRGIASRLPVAREKLTRQAPAPSVETIYGQVTRLERGEDDTQGVVTVRGVIGKSTQRQVKVALSGKDYNRAIQAHRSRRPISVKGRLQKLGRDNWLTDKIEFSDRL